MKNKLIQFIKKDSFNTYIFTGLLCIQLSVILLSWVLKAINPDSSIHSLLGRDGIRWFWGHFSDNINNRILVWMLFIGVLWGVLKESRFALLSFKKGDISYRERLGLKVFFSEIILILSFVLWLILAPNAILLSVTGHLFPSSFTSGVIPIASIIGVLSLSSYGFITGAFKRVSHVFHAMTKGITAISPYLILYCIVMELISSISYVIGY